jgi:hypothetical protein
MATPKIPFGLLGIPFGLSGLAEAWLALAGGGHAPVAAGEIILLIAAATWLTVLVAYLRYLRAMAPTLRAAVSQGLLDPVAAPPSMAPAVTRWRRSSPTPGGRPVHHHRGPGKGRSRSLPAAAPARRPASMARENLVRPPSRDNSKKRTR